MVPAFLLAIEIAVLCIQWGRGYVSVISGGRKRFFWQRGFLPLPKTGEKKKTDKEKSHKGIWRSDAPEASQGQTRDVPGTPGTFGMIYVYINTKGTECHRDRRDIPRDMCRMSPGQTGRTPGGVPPKFFMFIGFFFPQKQGILAKMTNVHSVHKKRGGLLLKLLTMTKMTKMARMVRVTHARALFAENPVCAPPII